MTKTRKEQLIIWLKQEYPAQVFTLEEMTGDAGFRCYYRVHFIDFTLVAVDALPDKSNNVGFVNISAALKQAQIPSLSILKQDLSQGFFCITDLGNYLLADKLQIDNMQEYYQRAIAQLLILMNIKDVGDYTLPAYDADFVKLELTIFSEWLLDKHLSLVLTDGEQTQLLACFDVLIKNATEQPYVFMHRDFHSRNLMLQTNHDIAVIDFQDAVHGPITYDIVSLLRDCYVRWPDEAVNQLFQYFIQQVCLQDDSLKTIKNATWQRWFDLMGLQRHIKASGIFARLYHRDGKNGYLKDIPLTLTYIVDIANKYPELKFLSQLVTKIQPIFEDLA